MSETIIAALIGSTAALLGAIVTLLVRGSSQLGSLSKGQEDMTRTIGNLQGAIKTLAREKSVDEIQSTLKTLASEKGLDEFKQATADSLKEVKDLLFRLNNSMVKISQQVTDTNTLASEARSTAEKALRAEMR